jgi:hypothetical protein
MIWDSPVLWSYGKVWKGAGPGSVQNLAGYQAMVLQATNRNSVYVGYAKEECEVYLEYDTAGIIESCELKGRKYHW